MDPSKFIYSLSAALLLASCQSPSSTAVETLVAERGHGDVKGLSEAQTAFSYGTKPSDSFLVVVRVMALDAQAQEALAKMATASASPLEEARQMVPGPVADLVSKVPGLRCTGTSFTYKTDVGTVK